jgi:hypothetical protein
MAMTVTVTGKVQVQLEDGQVPAPIDLGASFPVTQRADFERVYAGAVTDDVVDLGTLATGGAKLVLIKVTQGAATVKMVVGVTVDLNPIPLNPGAYHLYCNPSAGFPTGAKITTTGAATVKFIALG